MHVTLESHEMKDLFMLIEVGEEHLELCLLNFPLLAPECSMFKIHCSRGCSQWREEITGKEQNLRGGPFG